MLLFINYFLMCVWSSHEGWRFHHYLLCFDMSCRGVSNWAATCLTLSLHVAKSYTVYLPGRSDHQPQIYTFENLRPREYNYPPTWQSGGFIPFAVKTNNCVSRSSSSSKVSLSTNTNISSTNRESTCAKIQILTWWLVHSNKTHANWENFILYLPKKGWIWHNPHSIKSVIVPGCICCLIWFLKADSSTSSNSFKLLKRVPAWCLHLLSSLSIYRKCRKPEDIWVGGRMMAVSFTPVGAKCWTLSIRAEGLFSGHREEASCDGSQEWV